MAPRTPARRRLSFVVAFTCVAGLLVACAPGGADPADTTTAATTVIGSESSPTHRSVGTTQRARAGVKMSFDEAPYPPSTPVDTLRNKRDPGHPAVVVSAYDGQVRSVAGLSPPEGPQNVAVSFPAFNPSATAPRAGVALTDLEGADDLAPGQRRFTFGADFRLDPPPTSSREAGSTDNGDNLLQRGLADEPVQLKLQLDDRTPSCHLHAYTAGVSADAPPEQVVTIDDPAFVPLDTSWYRVRCTRTTTHLTLRLLRLDDSGTVVARTTASTPLSTVLDLTWTDRTVPFTLGAKQRGDGLMTDADQFNGDLDDVIFNIQRP